MQSFTKIKLSRKFPNLQYKYQQMYMFLFLYSIFRIGTLLAITMGIYMSACRHVATSKIWWLIGTISFAALYYLPTWQGYCGEFSMWTTGLDKQKKSA